MSRLVMLVLLLGVSLIIAIHITKLMTVSTPVVGSKPGPVINVPDIGSKPRPIITKVIKLQANLTELRSGILQFMARYGRFPSNLNELVENNVLHKIPGSPFGGGYGYEPSTGKIWSKDYPDY